MSRETLDINRSISTCETLIEAEPNSGWVRYIFPSSSSSQAMMHVLTESTNFFHHLKRAALAKPEDDSEHYTECLWRKINVLLYRCQFDLHSLDSPMDTLVRIIREGIIEKCARLIVCDLREPKLGHIVQVLQVADMSRVPRTASCKQSQHHSHGNNGDNTVLLMAAYHTKSAIPIPRPMDNAISTFAKDIRIPDRPEVPPTTFNAPNIL
jgi:hypothetical protein